MGVEHRRNGTTYPRGFSASAEWRWPLVPARELVTLNYGRALKADARNIGRIPVYGTNGPCGWHSEALTTGPGVILGRKGQGPLGVEWCDTDFWVIDTAYFATPLTSDLDLKYFYYLTKYVGLNHLKDGTSNPTLSRASFGAQLFPFPPLPKQKAIAAVLGVLDDKIELNRRMNATLEAMARALFQSWFVDFDPVRAKLDGRQPTGLDPTTAALFPSEFEDSELGTIPKGWEARPLAEMVQIVKGRSYRSEELAESKTALVTLKSFLRGGGYRVDVLKPFTGEYKPNQRVHPGDLVVAFTDVTQAADVIGKPALICSDDRFDTLVASLDVGIIRPKSNRVSVPFLYCLFLTSEFQGHTYSHTTGTTVLHLSAAAIPSSRRCWEGTLLIAYGRVRSRRKRCAAPICTLASFTAPNSCWSISCRAIVIRASARRIVRCSRSHRRRLSNGSGREAHFRCLHQGTGARSANG